MKVSDGSAMSDTSFQVTQDRLTFVTYNVWFGDLEQEKRYNALLNILKESDADFICLQEVTKIFLEILSEDKKISLKYFFSNSKGSSFSGYDVMMLNKKEFGNISFEICHLPTTLGRKLLFADVIINEKKSSHCTFGKHETIFQNKKGST